MDLDTLEEALGYRFSDRTLLLEALTHKTWWMEECAQGREPPHGHQQRLEFLGDAFIGYAIARQLFEEQPEAEEGSLTDQRKALIRKEPLGGVGRTLRVLDLLRLGRGERANASSNQKVCEDTVEALVGAVLLDDGESSASRVVQRLVSMMEPVVENPIPEFNELWQKTYRTSPPEPVYQHFGADHTPTWRATVELPNGGSVSAEASSKQAAKRAACRKALVEWPSG